MERGLACEAASPEYRYLESFFEGGPALVLSDPAAPPVEKERKIDIAMAQLEEGINKVFESDNYRQYLQTLGKFHDYSLGNLILIWIQKNDASRVAGFNTWKDLGRFVKKGEKGLMILAPCFPPKGKREKKPATEEEEPEEEEVIRQPIYFRVVYVFDISQTEGADLPTVEVPVVQGDDSRPLFDLLNIYAAKIGLTVVKDPSVPVNPQTMGYLIPKTRELWVRGTEPVNQQTKSMAHEIAHSKAIDLYGPGAEVLAESVAFAVCSHFGFDTGVRSFPYVALWAQDIKLFKEKLEQIRTIAKEMIDEVSVLAELRDPGCLGDPGKYERLYDLTYGRLSAMMLLTKENRKALPPLRAQEHADDPIAYVKFFTPWSNWTWYATEFDGEDEFFGLVQGHEIELGYFSLKELESVRGPFGLRIERDRHFDPTPLSVIRSKLEAGSIADKVPGMADLVRQMAELGDYGKQEYLESILKGEVYVGHIRPERSALFARAEQLKRLTLDKLKQRNSSVMVGRLEQDRTVQRVVYTALGKPVPAWLQDRFLEDVYDIEELADDEILPAMKDYPGDKMSLKKIKDIPKTKASEKDIEAALDYLEGAGEVMSFEADEVKPKRWAVPEDSFADLGDVLQDFILEADDVNLAEDPQYIEVTKNKIAKHYRPTSTTHQGSIRITKPAAGVIIYLGCPKDATWSKNTCSDNQVLIKTVVPRNAKNMERVKKLEKKGIEVLYRDRSRAHAGDQILEEVAEALQNPEAPV